MHATLMKKSNRQKSYRTSSSGYQNLDHWKPKTTTKTHQIELNQNDRKKR